MSEIWEVLKYIFPLIILGGIIYFLFEKLMREESDRRRLELKLKDKDLIMPQRLNAYERMALFLERIRPTYLVRRVNLVEDINLYEMALVNAVQEEYDHNLSQQIYIDPDTWKMIFSAKNATLNFIKQNRSNLGENATSDQLRNELIHHSVDGNSPSNAALLKLQADIQGIF